MAENTQQFRWIVTIQGGLDSLFRDDPNVFVAGDLLWYPVERSNHINIAPDAMVVFGRPKADRLSYLQWMEDDITPQVVFEVVSPSNTEIEMLRKRDFYERYGVEECYVYDPKMGAATGWMRSPEGHLRLIEPIHGHVSPRLGIRFDLSGEDLVLYRPDGRRLLTYVELDVSRERAEQARSQAEQRAAQAEQERERLAALLRQAGIDPDAANPQL